MKRVSWLKKLFPFESRFISIAGHQMHYIDEGSGPVVILLHGNPTWSFFYRNLIERLREDFRVIAPDFIGCGLSDHPVDDHFRAADRISHLEELVDKLEIKKFSLVMHDWGGALGTALAVGRVGAVERLVYLNTTLTETESLPMVIKTAAQPVIGKFLTKYSKFFLRFTTDWGVVKRLPKYVKKAYYYPYRTVARRTAIWDFVADIPFDRTHPSYADMLDLANKLSTLSDTPVQIVWGLRDPCFHREMLSQVCAHFPHARICEIAEASHLVLEDAPDVAFPIIHSFLRGGSTESGDQIGVEPEDSAGSENFFYQALQRAAEKTPEDYAVIVPSFIGENVKYEQTRFDQFMQLVRKYERGLTELGLRAGDKVLMLVSPGTDYLAYSYAVMGRGAVPYFLDPGMGKEKLIDCIDRINPDVFIGSPKAQLLRILKRKKLFPKLKFHVTTTDWFFTGGPTSAFLKKFSSRPLPPASSGGIAMVAYTSGATGAPKGVVFTNAMVEEQLRIFSEVFGIDSGKRDLPLLPIFAIFNIALGVGIVFPPMDPSRPLSIDPPRIVKLINDLRISYSFGSPTLWNKIAEYCVRIRCTLPTLEKVLMAGAPVSDAVLSLVQSTLDQGTALTPYGATEALPVTMISAEQIQSSPKFVATTGETGTLVGQPVSGVSVKIIQPTDGPIEFLSQGKELAPGEIGEVIVSGKNVSQEYFENGQATASSKIVEGDRLWHRMGDVGYVDTLGNLYFCGRYRHKVSIGAKIYYSVPIENIFNVHPKIFRSALVSLHNGSDVGLVVEPIPRYWPDTDEMQAEFIDELLTLAAKSPLTADIKHFFFHHSFPVDGRHNAKIFRDQLSEWASQQSGFQRAA